jgi:tetratricopeptide (TPR) repeat protein
MAKISLRVYNREIETMIDRGQTDEAIAHCKYILKTYPKHLETYRLLGKAFLESQRYSEAADILQRILSVQPDDFVSQIGMSIIREDEGNLDAAIYHMERAFEIQPSNAAIQDELRRLYGRRDGIEPPKLRLTRGALVRMYARGDLYRQAIAESRAALKEDPQRLDLEIVLARMYYQTGQKAEAAEISSRLVTKLPYCFEANRILAEVLSETSRVEEVRGVQQKLLSLDPYLGYTEAVQGVQQSPDNAVTLDRLEWSPSLETDQQPAWARSLGVKIDEGETEKMPQWMTTIDTGQPSSETPIEETPSQPFSEEPSLFEDRMAQLNPVAIQPTESPADQEIPDWMQTAGWTISDHPAAEEPILPEETPDLNAAAPAELPGWLKDMAPDQSAQSEDQGISYPPVNLEKAETVPTSEEDLPDWFKSPPVPVEDNLFTAPNDEPLPDWLMDAPELQSTPSNEPEDSGPLDWLTPQAETSAVPAENPPQFLEAPTFPVVQEPFGAETSTIPAENPPVILEALAIPVDQEPNRAKTSPISLEKSRPQDLQGPPDQVPAIGDQPDLNDFDQTMAWLEGLAAKQGAEEGTLLTNPDERPSAPPEWVAQAAQESEVTPTASAMEISDKEPPAPISLLKSKNTTRAEATPTEVTTPPELESVGAAVLPIIPLVSEPVSETQIPEGEAELQEANVEAVEVPAEMIPSQQQSQGVESPPDQTTTTTPVDLSQPPAAETGGGEEMEMDMDAAFAWLESLAAKQGAEADSLLVAPEQRQETPPDWVQQQSLESGSTGQVIEEIPSQTTESFQEQIKSSDETPISTEDWQPSDKELPDWLKEAETSSVSEFSEYPTASVEPAGFPYEEGSVEGIPAPGATASAENETPAWIDSAEKVEPTETAGEQTDQKPPETPTTPKFGQTRPLPSWLAGGTPARPAPIEESPSAPETPALPDWLKQEETAQTFQTALEPAVQAESEGPALPEWLKNIDSETEEDLLPVASPLAEIPQPAPIEMEISSNPDEMIVQAQTALSNGHIELALSVYYRLIQLQQHLDETIHDLRDALYRYPVDSAIWQTLGDAYFQNNRVQDALDAYTKAEDFLK